MNEFDRDALLTDAFAEFVTVAGPAVSPPGAAVARTTVVHRRKLRAAVVVLATVVSVAIPITAYAALNRPTQAPAHRPTSTESVPSTSPPASPSTASPKPAPPDGRITIRQLTDGKVRVPRFARPECPSGLVQLQRVTTVRSAPEGSIGVYQIVYANLDNDSALETAALLTCRLGEPTERQIAGFDRDETGAIVSIGQVTADRAWTLAPAPGGGVTADVSDTPHLSRSEVRTVAPPPDPIALVEAQVVLRAPQPHGANVQVGALAPARRLELHDDQPPATVVEPEPRPSPLPQPQRPQDVAGRRGDQSRRC